MKKVKVHKFWIPAESSVGTSMYKLFVAKSDYDRAIKRIKELELSLEDIAAKFGVDVSKLKIVK